MGLEKRETASYRHACACVSACVRMCVPLSRCGEKPGGSTASCRTEGQLVEGQEKHKAPRGTAPPPESRPVRVYLTLRVLSSLDQESVEGKEGRDEEEVTSALLPIWKRKKKHTWENTKQTKNPTTYPGFSPGLPSKRILKSNSLCEINAEISVTSRLTARLTDDRSPEMFTPLVRCLPEVTWNLQSYFSIRAKITSSLICSFCQFFLNGWL